jgi:hypothetical protein
LQEHRRARSRAGVDRERIDADLGPSEVEVVDGPVNGRQTETEFRERSLWIDQDDGAIGVGDVVGEMARHDRALAAALAADERVAVFAVLGRERHGPVLVVEQHARRVALDLGRRDCAAHRGARQARVLDARAWELPQRRELRG